MIRLWRVMLGLTLVFGLATGCGPRASAQDWAGDWVWTVEDRPALVLSLDATGEGRLSRPQRMTMDANADYWRLIDPSAEVATLPVTVIASEADVLSLRTVDPEDGETTDYRLTRTGPEQAELTLADIAAGPLFALQRATETTQVATDWTPGRAYGGPPVVADNADLARLFADDQAARQGPGLLGLETFNQDAERRVAVRVMLDDGQVRSATDHYHAAFIFQHGDKPENYLLAHALAVAAIARGRDDAAWIAAATLDRYLQSIGRPQIYGTQYQIPGDGSGTTQGGYDRDLVPDSLRITSGVPPLAAQAEQLRAYDRME